jgi:hypothetical protein
MIEQEILELIRSQIAERAQDDHELLDQLRRDARRLRSTVQVIRPRLTTAVSLVASDGGHNALRFDPLLIHLVRVMDSKGKQLCLDVVSQKTDVRRLNERITQDPENALGQLMSDLGVSTLWGLSHMIPRPDTDEEEISPAWPQVYRDLCEWAVLYRLITRTTFATDTLVVRDGFLKSKLFRGERFIEMCDRMWAAIEEHQRRERVQVWLVGIAKHSKVIERYRLAMALEHVFASGEPAYACVPDRMTRRAIQWEEYVRPPVRESGREAPKFNYGTLHLVRFGRASGDPIWAVDILYPQREQHAQIMGYLLQDAIEGFPVPFYPRCLQRAHEHAQLVDLDVEILQNEIYNALRSRLNEAERWTLDALRLNPDPARLRYERE